jgi:FtsH-binding integral membrane protein
MIYGCLGTITFYGYIVYDTDKLIKKRFTYAKYISVAVNLYLHVIPIFLSLLLILIVAENKNVV